MIFNRRYLSSMMEWGRAARTTWFIFLFIIIYFNAFRAHNEQNETLCINHLWKCQMNTFWWWRWKCVYTNIISTTSLILNGRVTSLSNAHTYTYIDTNCVHWAKSEIDQAAPEEWIIYVSQRSFNSSIGTSKNKLFLILFLLDKIIDYTIFSRWLFRIGLNFKLVSDEKKKKHMDHHFFLILISVNHVQWRMVHRLRLVSASTYYTYIYIHTYARKKKTLLCPSSLCTDGSNTAGISWLLLFFWLLPIHVPMCNSRNLTSSI